MIARGKREARRPWLQTQHNEIRPEGPKYAHSISPFQGWRVKFFISLPGATRSLRCALAPGCHMLRLRRCSKVGSWVPQAKSSSSTCAFLPFGIQAIFRFTTLAQPLTSLHWDRCITCRS